MEEIKYEGSLFDENGLSVRKIEGKPVAVLENLNHSSEFGVLEGAINKIKESGIEGVIVDFRGFPINDSGDRDMFAHHFRTLADSGVNYALSGVDKSGLSKFSLGFRERIMEDSYRDVYEAIQRKF